MNKKMRPPLLACFSKAVFINMVGFADTMLWKGYSSVCFGTTVLLCDVFFYVGVVIQQVLILSSSIKTLI